MLNLRGRSFAHHNKKVTWSKLLSRGQYARMKTITLDWSIEFPDRINWTNPFRDKRLLDTNFKFYSNFKSAFSKQTVQSLITRLVLWHLIWF